MKAIVIGSGVSGLTAAAALAQAGVEVSVFEQFHQAGGVTAAYESTAIAGTWGS
jgi:glutamate synthase (NADPH) small chain